MSAPLQVTDDAIRAACGVDPGLPVEHAGLVCRNVFRWTEDELVARAADWLATKPLKIVLILLTAFVLNRLVRRTISHLLERLTNENAQAAKRRLRELTPRVLMATSQQSSLRSTARSRTIGLVLKSAATVAIYSVATLTALSEFGINLAPLIAGAGIVGVALGFGAQSLVRDFLSGLFILAEDQYGVGDVIDVDGTTGTVEAVNLRTTKLRSVEGTVWHIPNGEIHKVGNMSQQWARALLDVEVTYGTDLGRASEIVKSVADGLSEDEQWRNLIIEEPEVWGIERFDVDGVAIRLVVKTQPGEQFRVSRELRRRIKDRFEAERIEMPFPRRIMWVNRDPGSSADLEGVDVLDGSD